MSEILPQITNIGVVDMQKNLTLQHITRLMKPKEECFFCGYCQRLLSDLIDCTRLEKRCGFVNWSDLRWSLSKKHGV